MRAAGRTGRVVAALCAAAALAPGAPAPAEEKAPELEYVRNVDDFDKAARLLVSREGFDAVLVVLDALSFNPPPGENEFSLGGPLKADLDAWIAALGAAATKGRPLYAAASVSAAPLHVGDAGWAETVREDLGRPWWTAKKPEKFEPAKHWMTRLLGHVPGKRKLVAVVAGTMTPEDWRGLDSSYPENRWRRALAPVGEYFDEEDFADAVAAKGGVLWFVSPESRFGDETPLADLPFAPWASRPSVPFKLPGPIDPKAPPPDMTKDDLDKLAAKLRGWGVPDAEAKSLVKGLGRGSTLDDPLYPETGRFTADTAGWQSPYEQIGLFATACPSGYGWWPYARAAAKTGGGFILYPGSAANWSDRCPRDASFLDAMAPELVSEEQYVKSRASDGVLAAMLAAQKIVLDAAPWTVRGGPRPASWCGFDAPGHKAKDWRRRKVPLDDWYSFDEGSNDRVAKNGRAMAAAAAKYDDALAVLDKALAEVASGALRASRRSQANLRLAKLWFAQSAFHLQSAADALVEADRVRVPGTKGDLYLGRREGVRLSDCLDAWDMRVVPEEIETKFAGRLAWEGEFGNLLGLGTGHPFFRARRAKDAPFAKLTARLRPRAEAVVAAAGEVMKNEPRCAWGWSAYYSGIEAFHLSFLERTKSTPPPKGATGVPPPPPDPSPTTPGASGSPGSGGSGGGDSTPK